MTCATKASSTLAQQDVKDGSSTALVDLVAFFIVLFFHQLVVSHFMSLHK